LSHFRAQQPAPLGLCDVGYSRERCLDTPFRATPQSDATSQEERDMKCWIGAVVVGLTFSSIAQAQDAVRIAVGVDPVFTPWWIAQEKGMYAKYRIKADITQFSGGPALADATMGGEADIGSSGTGTWMPRLVREPMVVFGRLASSPDAFKMAAHRSLRSLADLKGKKVGSVGGSTTDYLWVLTAKKLGVPESAFQVIGMPPPELVPSLDRGDIQAYFVWEPWASRAVEVSGKDKVHILANSGDIGYFLNFIVVGNKKFVDAKPDVTTRVLAALRDAVDFQLKNPAEATRIGAATNKLKPEMAAYVIGLYKFSLEIPADLVETARTEEAWMRSKQRLKGEPIDWNKAIDRRFFDRAMALK
jgi:NitT/TauT family transport system substrate-binding protein